MRFEGSFYRLGRIEPAPEGYRIEVELAADHPVYAGHFPGKPVVPGACTLTIVRECLAQAVGRRLMFGRIKECKFVSALVPRAGLTLVLDLKTDGCGFLRGQVLCGERTILKLQAELRPDD